jgi:hypothetical protein
LAAALLESSPCPVVIVPPAARPGAATSEPPGANEGPVTRILAPFDISPSSSTALGHGFRLASELGADVEALHLSASDAVNGEAELRAFLGGAGVDSTVTLSIVERARFGAFLESWTRPYPNGLVAVSASLPAEPSVTAAEVTLRGGVCPVLVVPGPMPT